MKLLLSAIGKTRASRATGWVGAALLAVAFGASPAAAQTFAVTNAKLVIGDGSAPIENGTVLVRDGRVVAAGANVAVPAGTNLIDAGGKYVTPGIFAGFSHLGIVEVDGVDPTDDSGANSTPFHAAIDVTPAVNPLATPIAINRTAGVTRAVVAPEARKAVFAGQGAVIDLSNGNNDVTVPRAFQFMEWGENGARQAGGSRPAAWAALKDVIAQVEAYRANPARFLDRGTDALINRADAAALVPVLDGKVPLLVHVERASDIRVLLGLKRELPQLKLVLVGATEGWMLAREIAAAKVPVLASALNDLPESFEQVAATQSNVGRMVAAGVTVGLATINNDEAREVRWEKQYAGNLVALGRVPGATGLSWGQAFAAISSKPAEALGLGDRLGSLRPGRSADIVLWDGDPLELGTTALAVFIDGVRQPLENRQTRLLIRYMEPQEGALPKAYQR